MPQQKAIVSGLAPMSARAALEFSIAGRIRIVPTSGITIRPICCRGSDSHRCRDEDGAAVRSAEVAKSQEFRTIRHSASFHVEQTKNIRIRSASLR